jgi:hypothetical protein
MFKDTKSKVQYRMTVLPNKPLYMVYLARAALFNAYPMVMLYLYF